MVQNFYVLLVLLLNYMVVFIFQIFVLKPAVHQAFLNLVPSKVLQMLMKLFL